MSAPLPANESQRLAYLAELEVLDTDLEASFDDITRLAAAICGTPIALVSLVDEHRQWFKSKLGLDVRETPREHSFCAHAILGQEVFEISDAQNDSRFQENPLVTGAPRIRFYAGAPLLTPSGLALGSLCVIDNKSRSSLSPEQRELLAGLSRQVMALLSLNWTIRTLSRRTDRMLDIVERRDQMMTVISHDLRAPFSAQIGLCDLAQAALEHGDIAAAAVRVTAIRASALGAAQLVDNLLNWSTESCGGMTVQMESIAAADAISDAWTPFIPTAAAKRITLYVASPPDIFVNADSNVLRSVLMNLIGNAIKFSPPGKAVEVRVSGAAASVEVSVSDHGDGMAPDRVIAINTAEDSVNSSPGTIGEWGTGLGLSLSRMLIRRIGGTVKVSSVEGEGTTVRVNLARYVSSEDAPPASHEMHKMHA